MKILIAADMEGITGVVDGNQTNPSHAEYGRFRRLMTGDVNAAIQARSTLVRMKWSSATATGTT